MNVRFSTHSISNMKSLAGTVIVLAAMGFMSGCASRSPAPKAERPPSTLPSQADLVGTWQFISVTDASGTVHQMNSYPFFMRFYADGKCASWPVPKEEITSPGAFNTDAKRISRGVYKVEDGLLSLPDAPDSGKTPLQITSEKMLYTTSEGDTCLYFRVQPDLEPGNFP